MGAMHGIGAALCSGGTGAYGQQRHGGGRGWQGNAHVACRAHPHSGAPDPCHAVGLAYVIACKRQTQYSGHIVAPPRRWGPGARGVTGGAAGRPTRALGDSHMLGRRACAQTSIRYLFHVPKLPSQPACAPYMAWHADTRLASL